LPAPFGSKKWEEVTARPISARTRWVTERIASNGGSEIRRRNNRIESISSQPLLNALGRPEEEKTGTDIFLPLTNRLNGRPVSEAAGWTRERIADVARGYREIAKITPQNQAAPVRAQQLESLFELFK